MVEDMPKCIVKGCVTNTMVMKSVTLYKIPSATEGGGSKRTQWMEAIGEASAGKGAEICHFHFVEGAPSKDANSIDYVPSLNLSRSTSNVQKVADCEELNHCLKIGDSKRYPDYKTNAKNAHGFKRNLVPERVVGIVEIKDGQRCMLIKWKNNSSPDFVPCQEANDKCPNLVIEFYQSLICFTD